VKTLANFAGKARKILQNAAEDVGQKATKTASNLKNSTVDAINRTGKRIDNKMDDILDAQRGKVMNDEAFDATKSRMGKTYDLNTSDYTVDGRGRARSTRGTTKMPNSRQIESNDPLLISEDTTKKYNRKTAPNPDGQAAKATPTEGAKSGSNEASKGRSGLLSSAKRHPVVAGTLAAGGVAGTTYMLGKSRGKRSNSDLYRR